MERYSDAKANILLYQKTDDAVALGRDDPGSWSLAHLAKGRITSFGFSSLPAGQDGAFLHEDAICLRLGGANHSILKRNEVALRGDHNVLNILAACLISALAGLPVEAMRAGVSGFTGVAHRLEFVRNWGGAAWYNDSMATAPERSMAAIHSFDEPLVVLVGGRDKSLPWQDFARLARQRVDHLILFGEAAEKISQALIKAGVDASQIIHCKGLRQAVQAAAQVVQPGDVVLLSPGGTSFDEFFDFEERGRCFVQWVSELP
jgi:UDP-N-acetylmuramoylalanine--D-glutamate ligase